MSSIKVVRIIGYYRDASFLEMLVANFRKLLVDIEWIYGRMLDETRRIYEVYVGLREHPNLEISLLNLSKMVGIESFQVINDNDNSMMCEVRNKTENR